MTELRKDPIVDRYVIVAQARSERPGAFLQAGPAVYASTLSPNGGAIGCPFCIGNESKTPPAVYEQPDGKGRWLVRIVPNKYPAVVAALERSSYEGDVRLPPALGVHEIVVESSKHAVHFERLAPGQLVAVLSAWRDRIAEHRRAAEWPFLLLFKNSGREAGASIEHVHSQIVALARIPLGVQAKLDAAARSYEEHHACAFCRLIAAEREAGVRVVFDRDGIFAATAFAGRQPYETWMLPAVHEAAYDCQQDGQLEELASALAQVLQALRKTMPDCAYNLILHTAPFDTRWGDRYHWHIEIIPRVAGLAGFELGTGEYINPVSPERAAGELNRILGANDKL